jgi:hypothetical protein
MLFNVSITYSTWNDEAYEAGDTDDKGFEIQDEKMDLRELIKTIDEGGFNHLSTQPYDGSGSVWISNADGDTDMFTGETTYRNIHIDATPRNLKRIFKLAGLTKQLK